MGTVSTEPNPDLSLAPTASQTPPLECDLVMKGGITSGVVYPLAVCELATTYRLRSVGGSSAGAIAAAAAACAEMGRASGGFDRLAKLPHDLTETVEGENSRLFTLFEPQPTMRRLFGFATAGLGEKGMTRTKSMLGAALRSWILYAALGALLGVVLIVLGFVAGGAAAWVGLVSGLVLVVVGAVVGIGYGVFRDVRRIPDSGFGLCSGFTHDGDQTPALTAWLHATFQGLAGRTVDDDPITFGDLDLAQVTLQLMTTNLSRRQPIALPWGSGEFYFEPAHFRTLFPEKVVARMEHSTATTPTTLTADQWVSEVTRLQAQGGGLLPFPSPADLPIVVAVRMSLSFPGLIAAVPLHAVDYSLEKNKQVRIDLRTQHREHPEVTPDQAAGHGPRLDFQRNWFSDGGICANLPLHFFDSALPRRPTFAIDLADFPVDRKQAPDELDNSYLPVTNSQGLLRRQSDWSDQQGIGLLATFFSSIIDTARTWVDEAQLSMPGYRDRIVTVFTAADEGGMNLNMKQKTVLRLSQRGQGAALRLVRRFAGDHPGVTPAEGWDNHRWLRFRTATAAFSETLQSFRNGFTTTLPGSTAYDVWVGDHADGPLPSYPLTKGRREAVNRRTDGLLGTADEWLTDPPDAFTHDAPQPRPTMRLVPTDRVDDLPPG